MAPWMIGAPFALVGAVILWIGLRFLGRDQAIKHWPSVEGVITSATIDATTTRVQDRYGYWQTWESCVPKVSYSYTVEGRKLEGSRITRDQMAMTRPSAKRCLDRYPVQQTVKVYYDPADLTSTVLERRTSVGAVILTAMGSFFALFGLALSVLPILLG